MLEIRKTRGGKQRSIHEREHRKRTVRRTVGTIVILLFLMIISAVVYVWYMGRHPIEQATQIVNTGSAAPTIKAPAVDPNARVGIVQQSFSGTVVAGSNASISIKTNPEAACQISVRVNTTVLPDTGLVPKIADEFGIVEWSWSIPAGLAAGKLPVEITCANEAKKSAYYKTELEVKKAP